MRRVVRQGRLLQFGPDRIGNAAQVCKYLVVPEPHDTISARLKIARPACVMRDGRIVRVLRTVQLNDEARFTAKEIQYVGPFRNLTPEFPSIELAVSQP